MLKKLLLTTAAIAVSTSAAFATGLTIVNHTKLDSTVKVGSTCSSIIGSNGITKAGATKTISSMVIGVVCQGQNPCNATLYLGDTTCQNPKAMSGTATLNTTNDTITALTDSNGHHTTGIGSSTATLVS